MSVLYLDTSALAKRYISETGSAWIRGLVAPRMGNIIVICDFTPIEIFSLIARRQRDGLLSPPKAALLKSGFLKHQKSQYVSILLEPVVLTTARDFVGKHLLRPPDALQLACALRAIHELGEQITFICADQNLLTAAQAEGLATDNPNLHP